MDRQIEEAISNRKGLTTEVKDYIKNEIEKANKSSEKKFEDLKAILQSKIQNLVENPVPMGFIYVQLKDQPEPSKIWPGVGWTEVSSSYPGLFFRVAGGAAGGFGTIQQGASPRLTSVKSIYINTSNAYNTSIPAGSWSSFIFTGKHESPHLGLQFYADNPEVRPTNTAMRIWKRTK